MKNTLIKILTIFCLTGCGSILSPVEQRQSVSYEIYDNNTASSMSNQECNKLRTNNVLFVSPMHAYVPYDNLKMYYSKGQYEVNAFGYSQWIALPADMLTQAMSKKIYNSCLFKNLTTSNALADANYRLISLLTSLRQEINSENNSVVVHMSIAVELIDLNSNKVIASKVFSEGVPTAVGPIGFVKGVNQLTDKFDQNLIIWLKQNI